MLSLVSGRSLTRIFLSASETRFGALCDHEAGISVAFSLQRPQFTLSHVVVDVLTPARQVNTLLRRPTTVGERLAFLPMFFIS